MRECVIEREEKQGTDVLHLCGALDAYSLQNLEFALDELKQSQRCLVVLECGNLEYISSAALGALVGFARTAREAGGDLKLANLSPKIWSIVELLGFHKILEIYPTVDEAVEKFA